MNVIEINPDSKGTLPHYFAVAFPFTIATAWVIIAFQSKHIFKDRTTFFKRLGWPVYFLIDMIKQRSQKDDSSIEVILRRE
jgi:hypothetical protein